MEKKLTNSDPLREPADKHSIYAIEINSNGLLASLSDVSPHLEHHHLQEATFRSKDCHTQYLSALTCLLSAGDYVLAYLDLGILFCRHVVAIGHLGID